MPHRVAEFVERCSLCDEEQSLSCKRCSRPLCADHEPSTRHRCSQCETEYGLVKIDFRNSQVVALRNREAEKTGGALVGLGVGSLAGLFIGFSQSIGWTLAVVLPVVFFCVIGVNVSRRQNKRELELELQRSMAEHRQKFLAERPRRQLTA